MLWGLAVAGVITGALLLPVAAWAATLCFGAGMLAVIVSLPRGARSAAMRHTGSAATPEAASAAPEGNHEVAAELASFATNGLFFANANGEVAWANPACLALVGKGEQLSGQSLGARWRDWLHPDDVAGLADDVAAPTTIQARLARDDARMVHLDLTPSRGGIAGSLTDVTELVVAQDILARRESDYQLMAHATTDVGLYVSAEGLVMQTSPAIRLLTGTDPTAIVGRQLVHLFHPGDRERVAGALAAARGGATRLVAGKLLGEGSSTTWVDVTIRRGGPMVGLATTLEVTLRDITERRWAEEEITRRQHMLETVTNSSPVGIFAVHGARWTFANPRLEEISGLSRQQLLEGALWEYVHPEDRLQPDIDRPGGGGVDDTHGDLAEGPASGYYRLLRPDGEERWIHLRMAQVTGEEGRAWVGTVEDTTNEVTARQHSMLLATVVASTTDLVSILSPDGRVRFLNRAGRELLGISRSGDVTHLHAARLFGLPGWKRLCEVALPTATGRGTWSGDAEIFCDDGTERPVSLVVVSHRDALGRVDRLSVVARDTSTQKATERRLAREASHDQLTGLPNRAHFHMALAGALATASRSDAPAAVLFCDLDRFKTVNDSLGHAAGDRVLREVAARLTSELRHGDIAARVGGDEFLVLARSVDGPTGALMIAERIREVLDHAVEIDDVEFHLSFSVGVALSEPGDSPTSLIARADEAMYRAKRLGKNRVQLYDPTTRRSTPASLVAEQALRHAIEHGELQLRYQPIVDLSTRLVVSCEALVRWVHPELGLLAPRDFIELAEETGLIRPLGSWVLTEAIRQSGEWARDLTLPAGLRMSVNLSAQQLVDGDLAERTAAMLQAMGLPAGTLCVELTERALATDEDVARAELQMFRDYGVAVAVDDFGTGYSSLAQLRRFPVDILKLDAGFVAGLGRNAADTAIVSTVQGLADALGLRTIAEGVENLDQLSGLLELGCTAAQGFLFSQALLAEDFAALVRRGPVELASPTGTASPSRPGRPHGDIDVRGDIAEDPFAGSQHRIA